MLDLLRQRQRTQEVAEIVGERMELAADLVASKADILIDKKPVILLPFG